MCDGARGAENGSVLHCSAADAQRGEKAQLAGTAAGAGTMPLISVRYSPPPRRPPAWTTVELSASARACRDGSGIVEQRYDVSLLDDFAGIEHGNANAIRRRRRGRG